VSVDAGPDRRKRGVAFAVLVGACVVVAVAVVVVAALRSGAERRESRAAVSAARGTVAGILDSGRPWVLFKAVDRYRPAVSGHMAVAQLGASGPGKPVPAGPECDRVAFAAGREVCLTPAGPGGFDAVILDDRLRPGKKIRLGGNPSRTRVSPSGRYGAATSFVTGHSYADVGAFSTRTDIIDLEAGRRITQLERFDVTRDGEPVRSRDRNFWGVTFVDDDRFYATMATGGTNYLVAFDMKSRTGTVEGRHVECPSLSPDGTRIAYKYAISNANPTWRIHVRDLRTGKDVELAETQSVDDQVAWLDDEHVLYGIGDTTWTVPADGSGAPKAWLRGGNSPALVAG
jgi:hypothetical protein